MSESFIIDLIRHFYLQSGAMENDFCVNDFNTDYVDAVFEESCFLLIF